MGLQAANGQNEIPMKRSLAPTMERYIVETGEKFTHYPIVYPSTADNLGYHSNGVAHRYMSERGSKGDFFLPRSFPDKSYPSPSGSWVGTRSPAVDHSPRQRPHSSRLSERNVYKSAPT